MRFTNPLPKSDTVLLLAVILKEDVKMLEFISKFKNYASHFDKHLYFAFDFFNDGQNAKDASHSVVLGNCVD